MLRQYLDKLVSSKQVADHQDMRRSAIDFDVTNGTSIDTEDFFNQETGKLDI